MLGETTGTDAAVHAEGRARAELGIFWVAPTERFDQFGSRLTIGRGMCNDIQLEGGSVSREHARIEREGPLWLLRDAGSKNGVWINGQRRELVALVAGDVLRIGDWVGVVCTIPAGVEAGSLFGSAGPGLLLSAPTLALLSSLEVPAKRDLAIAIYGETGTGKEGVAEAIHRHSERPGPLVAVNCATLSESMADGLLFGHRKGAFTGAYAPSKGFVRSADRGTLFLDEVSELPLVVQAKLLRVLEDRRVAPLGAVSAEFVDFRLVVACQEPLGQRVARGAFRGDLYARMQGAELHLPPLRERKQEVIRLLRHFMLEIGQSVVLDSQCIEALCCYDWPYNVRELKQLAQRLAFAGKARVGVCDLPESFLHPPGATPETPPVHASARRTAWLGRHTDELERLEIALRQCGGNLSRAALEARIPRHRARRLLAAEEERQVARRG